MATAHDSPSPTARAASRPSRISVPVVGGTLLALASLGLAWWWLGASVINPVTYATVAAPRAASGVWMIGPGVAVLAAVVLWRRAEAAWVALVPLALLVGLAVLAAADVGLGFLYIALVVAAAGWALASLRLPTDPLPPRLSRIAPILLAGAVIASTAWHALAQVDFWRHFLLGYADFGFFTTELEHCLPWADAADRFADTRMGYHCIPFFYLLTPGYALFRSPVFLMVVGPLALNLAALAFYDLARRLTGSASVGLIVGLAWLALPSISRLPYANTYGFQSIYLAVPWLAFVLDFGLTGRWKWAHLCLAGALLCEETVCGVAFGWGLYLLLFTPRRRDGALIVAIALAYLALTTQVIIPYFATAQTYTRVRLFGDANAGELLARLARLRGGWYLLALTAPLLVWLVRAPRLLLAAAPPLALVLMLQNPDWLNLKYWHQSSALPVLFAAAIVSLAKSNPKGREKQSRDREGAEMECNPFNPLPAALGLLVAALLAHQALGYSPITRTFALQQQSRTMAAEDPRLAVVRELRAAIPRDRTILATERLAAHFTDYRALYAGASPHPTDVVLVDTRDTWDTSGLRERAASLAASGACRIEGEWAGIVKLDCTAAPHPSDRTAPP